MRAPLSVRIADGLTDRMVTRHVSDLRFRKVVNGGNASASMRISMPRQTFEDLGPADRVYIYDGRNGHTAWDGYTDNPGAVDGSSGEGFDLSASGGIILAGDRSERLIYLDRGMDNWRVDDYAAAGVAPSATSEVGAFPDTTGNNHAASQCLYLQFTPGQPLAVGSRSAMLYDAFTGSPMTAGAIAGWRDAGVTDANYAVRLNAIPIVGGDPTPINTTVSTTAAVFASYAVADFPVDKIGFNWVFARQTSTTNVATDDVWTGLGEVAIYGHLLDRYGTKKTMSTAAHITLGSTAVNPAVDAYILASEIAEDLLGRILTGCDPLSATIDTTAVHIDQLAYLDGATPAQVFGDLTQLEPDFYWGIGETLPNGLHRFWYRARPTVARYEVSTKDTYRAPGGDFELCNRIAVYWTDSKGTKQTTIVGNYVEALGNKSPISAGALDPTFTGRIKDAEAITLPDGRGSSANAQRIGEQALAARAEAPKAATAIVDHPILNHETGKLEMPWELEPGGLVRVRETGDLLWCTETEYVDPDGATTLTLGEPVLDDSQRIARLEKTARTGAAA